MTELMLTIGLITAVILLVTFIGNRLANSIHRRRMEVERILNRSDADAIRSDWQAVGDDLRWAIRKHEDER